ncbi:MAG TPA: methionine adenosyltransferase [Gammaproteobacteria bacterium]|nr:methionine adenosyltransferase [Gammaproteobacteria bacterium]
MTTLANISSLAVPYGAQAVEIVERKGIGHPDTICDALAEELSRNLCRFYLDNFGLVLHHNVDKALLWGGSAQPAFGGGKVTAPIEIFLAGRATDEYKGVRVPIEALVEQSCTSWLQANLHALDPGQHIKLHSLIRPGSPDLVELYLRQEATGVALANDTSCGVGYAPLSEMERIVLQVEKTLNSPANKAAHPETGEDIKVMAIRRGDHIELTVSCAFIDRYIANTDDYIQKKSALAQRAEKAAASLSGSAVRVNVNTADNINADSLYMTVTGTSAESGDDGEVGRGNRVNGLITPYRPMNMEAAAGKNPVTHVGKLYNIVAGQIASSLVEELEAVTEAYCYLVSRIGSPVSEPMIVDIRVSLADGGDTGSMQKPVDEIVSDALANMEKIQTQLINREISVY